MSEVDALLRLALAAAAGAAVGLDREVRDKPAGLRTNAIVSLGAAMFTLIGLLAFDGGDPAARIAAQVVSGVGFLGAGAIIQQRDGVQGLTTAAAIWGAAAVGMGFGAGLFILAAGGTIVLVLLLTILGWAEGRIERSGQQPPRAGASPDA